MPSPSSSGVEVSITCPVISFGCQKDCSAGDEEVRDGEEGRLGGLFMVAGGDVLSATSSGRGETERGTASAVLLGEVTGVRLGVEGRAGSKGGGLLTLLPFDLGLGDSGGEDGSCGCEVRRGRSCAGFGRICSVLSGVGVGEVWLALERRCLLRGLCEDDSESEMSSMFARR